MSAAARARLALDVWRHWLTVAVALRAAPLPAAVARLGDVPPGTTTHAPPRLARAVHRVLPPQPLGPRCLIRALVLYRLLRAQGEQPQLVIGLPPAPTGTQAHAWVELDGADVGPPPGRAGHAELARYG
jgi:hypothetical protein